MGRRERWAEGLRARNEERRKAETGGSRESRVEGGVEDLRLET
jgi:hypothetical protein